MASLKPNRLFTLSTLTRVSSDGNGLSTPMRGNRPVTQKNYGLKVFSVLTLLALICLPIGSSQANLEELELNVDGRRLGFEYVETRLGAVAADDTRCSKIGADVLTRGGHAVDAAVATVLCVGVVNPTESSIGGGSFMIIRNASNNFITAFNMRETAPAAATETMFSADEVDFAGPIAAGIPGELKGLYQAHKMFGRLPWRSLFEPAIRFARFGFEVYPYLAQYAAEYQKEIKEDPGLSSILIGDDGEVLKAYAICYNKKLADTLEAVSNSTPDKVFFNGPIGKKLIEDIRAKDGIMTMTDLKNYTVDRPKVIEVNYLGYKLVGMPPPSSGTIGLAMVANILKNYGDVKKKLEGPLGVHRLTEAIKHMFAARMNLGDPNFVNITKVMQKMNSTTFGKKIWRKINDTTTFSAKYYKSSWRQLEDHGTSHQSIVDQDRNAVAITTSINAHFGGKFMSPQTGMIMNNQIGDFSFPKPGKFGHPNRCQPGKRPLSSMTPLIIFKDEKFVGVVGGTGGRNIIAAVIQTVLKHFAFGMPPHLAVHNARVYPKLDKRDLEYEDMITYTGEHIVLPPETTQFLASRHHNVTVAKFGAFNHFIVRSSASGTRGLGLITAVSDIRKGATPAAQQPSLKKFMADF